MPTVSRSQALLLLYLVAVLWGSTGIWSQISTLSSAEVVTGRTTVAAVTLFIVVTFQGRLFYRANWANPSWLLLCAGCLGLHWFCFFDCMRRSTVALGLVTYTTCPLFTALAEPLLRRERIALRPLGCACLALVGIWFVHPITSLSRAEIIPTIIGIASGLLMSLVALISRYKLEGVDSRFLSLALNTIIAVGAWLIAPLSLSATAPGNLSALLGLGILCSAVGQSLFIFGMRYIDSCTATLISTLEAPSGVILAWMILGEKITTSVTVGCGLVLLAVLLVLIKNEETDPC